MDGEGRRVPRGTARRLAWAAKDKITEVLSEGARLIKRAPRYPVYLLAASAPGGPGDGPWAIGWRVWAWAKLVKVWGSLRWSDLQAIIPAELSLVEGRLEWLAAGGFLLAETARSLQAGLPDARLKADGALEPKPAGYVATGHTPRTIRTC